MKQLYYVVQTLLHGRNANIIKIISLGLGLMMSILLFSRVAYEQSFDTCFKEHENLYQVWKRFHLKDGRCHVRSLTRYDRKRYNRQHLAG